MEGKDTVDTKLEAMGGFGRYQMLHTIILSTTLRCAFIWQVTAIVFTGYYNNHHCTVPANTTKDEWIPKITGPDGEIMYDQCHHYTEIGSNETVICEHGWMYDPGTFHPATGSIVSEWDLVCAKSNLVEISIVCLNVGCVMGTVISSPLGDRYGRRITFFSFLIVLILSGTACAFSPDIITFCVLCFIRGVGVTGVYTQGSVLSMEIIPKRVITIVVPASTCVACFQQMLIAFLAFLIPHWRYLQMTVSLIPAVFLPYYWWCPESFHWLYQNRHYEELDKVFLKVAEYNRSTAPTPVARPTGSIVYIVPSYLENASAEDIIASQPHDTMADGACNTNNSNTTTLGSQFSSSNMDSESYSTSEMLHSEAVISEVFINKTIEAGSRQCETTMVENYQGTREPKVEEATNVNPLVDFIRRPRTLTYLLVVCYHSFVSYIAFFGLVYLQGSLTGSVHLNIALNGLLGAIGILGSMLLLRRFGRRPSEASTFAFLGVMMIMSAASAYIPVPDGINGLLPTVFAMIAKLGETSSVSIFNFYGLEFVPTTIRSTVLGTMTGCGYAGSIVAPFISVTLIRVHFWIPGVVYGVLTLIAAGLTLLLPETRGRDLPKTAAEVEAWPKNLTQAEKLRLKEGRPRNKKAIEPGLDNPAAVFDDISCISSCEENGRVITQF